MDRLISRRTMFAGSGKYIKFADPEVERICIANWSSDGIGLTMEDAAAVTSKQLGTTFQDNTQITSFDELQYFTGLSKQYLERAAFKGCTSLQSIIVPSGVRCYGNGFNLCTNLFTISFNGDMYLYDWIRGGTSGGYLHIKKDFYGNTHDSGMLCEKLIVDGNAFFRNGMRGSSATWPNLTEVRINGDCDFTYTDADQNNRFLLANYSRVHFFEVCGNYTQSENCYFSQGQNPSGWMVHFAQSNIALPASKLFPNQSSWDSLSKIYVGDGSSAAHDDAILAQYLADADWAQYSAKLDTWYNYNGEYKN